MHGVRGCKLLNHFHCLQTYMTSNSVFGEIDQIFADPELPILEVSIVKAFGSDVCLLDGDSLLHYALSYRQLSYTEHHQTLSTIYVATRLLEQLTERGVRCRIFFVASSVQCWTPAGQLLRNLLIQQLKHQEHTVVDIVGGSDYEWDAEWRRYVHGVQPAYALVSTGFGSELCSPRLSVQKKISTLLMLVRCETTSKAVITC